MNNNIENAAQTLFQRRLNKACGPRLSEDCRPQNIAEALAIQSRVSELLALHCGDLIGAWKCLLPANGKVIVGPIYRSSIHETQPCPLLALKDQAVIEPEIAFIFRSALPTRKQNYSEKDIRSALGEIRMGFELIRSRYDNTEACEFPELLADGLLNQGLFLGPRIPEHRSELNIVLFDGNKITDLKGIHPNGDAIAPLLWLVNYLCAQGIGIEAGQAVITGSFAGVFKLPFNTAVSVEYRDLGKINLQFIKINEGNTNQLS